MPSIDSYIIVLIPILAILFAQGIKVSIKILKVKKIKWSFINAYGGMPSAHSAGIGALVTIVALIDGLNSTTFTISTILALLIVRDILGYRTLLSDQSKVLNFLVQKISKEEKAQIRYPLAEIKHKTPEIIAGLCIGTIIALALFYFVVV